MTELIYKKHTQLKLKNGDYVRIHMRCPKKGGYMCIAINERKHKIDDYTAHFEGCMRKDIIKPDDIDCIAYKNVHPMDDKLYFEFK